MSPRLEAMIEAARAAGRGLMQDREQLEQLRVSNKSVGDLVSAADLRAEETIREILTRFAPDYGFLGEEGGLREGASDFVWMVDPLDGTTNYLWGTPLFGMNIALTRGDEVLAGVILLPALDELYHAEQGEGAFLNGRRIFVSKRARLQDSVIALGIPFAGKSGHARFHAEFARLTEQTMGIRRTGAGSVDMAFVASGRFDAYFERVVTPWDMAAGAAIIQEAGGAAMDADGSALKLHGGSVCAGPAALVAALTEESRKAGLALSARKEAR